jgi:hypothetical protein
MSTITPAQVKEKQFLPDHFNPVEDFDAWLQGVINTQEALLKIRIGSLYDSSDTSIIPQVQAASLAMTCEDLVERRILRLSGNVSEDTTAQINALMKVRESYRQSASSAIERLNSAGSSSDTNGYTGEAIVSGGTSLLSGWPS